MPLPQKEPRSRWAFVTLVMFVVVIVAFVASLVMDSDNKSGTHRPSHITQSPSHK